MPIYEYRCTQGHTFEVMQRMTDDPLASCQTCEAPVERVFHPVAVHFKGSGFYTTDYGSRRRQRVQDLLTRAAILASGKHLAVHSFSRLFVREVFARYGAITKEQIASFIADSLPELAPRLPAPRKPWMSEDYRMSIFDAAAFALTFYYLEHRKKRAA